MKQSECREFEQGRGRMKSHALGIPAEARAVQIHSDVFSVFREREALLLSALHIIKFCRLILPVGHS